MRRPAWISMLFASEGGCKGFPQVPREGAAAGRLTKMSTTAEPVWNPAGCVTMTGRSSFVSRKRGYPMVQKTVIVRRRARLQIRQEQRVGRRRCSGRDPTEWRHPGRYYGRTRQSSTLGARLSMSTDYNVMTDRVGAGAGR